MTSSYNTIYWTACFSTTGSIQMLLTFIHQNLRATITRICKTQLGWRTSVSQNKTAVLLVFSLVKVLFMLLLFSATRRGFYPGAIAQRDDKCNFSGASAHSCSLNNYSQLDFSLLSCSRLEDTVTHHGLSWQTWYYKKEQPRPWLHGSGYLCNALHRHLGQNCQNCYYFFSADRVI